MSPEDREWRQGMRRDRNYVFNFKEEIVAYCRFDVDILRRCCLEFRELFHDVTDIGPFTTLTIASACNLVYRTNYLSKDTIAIIPPLGYSLKNRHSLFAHKWLSYTADKNEIYIHTHVMAASNVSVRICSTAAMKKRIPLYGDRTNAVKLYHRCGRTNAAKLYHRCQGDEQIRYVEFTSLYPMLTVRRPY